MGEGQGEFGISNENGAGGFALDLDSAGGEAIQVSRQVQVHDMQAFLQSFDEEFALPCVAREKSADVVGGTDFRVGPGSGDGLDGLNDSVGAQARKAERIIAGSVEVGADDLVRAGWELEFGLNVEGAQPGALGRGVLREDLDAEKLVEEP